MYQNERIKVGSEVLVCSSHIAPSGEVGNNNIYHAGIIRGIVGDGVMAMYHVEVSVKVLFLRRKKTMWFPNDDIWGLVERQVAA